MTINDAINEFNSLLDNPHSTLDDLSNIVNQLSVADKIAPSGAVTHLYTKVGDQKGFITPSVRALDHTDAFEFLDRYNDEIYAFASDVIRRNNPDFPDKKIKEMTDSFFYGNYNDKSNITKGLWGEVSEKFAKNTNGDVICHIGDINEAPNRVWWNSEMPQILSSDSGVTTINGVPARHVRNIYEYFGGSGDLEALNKVNDAIAHINPNNTNKDALVSALGLADDVDLKNKYSLIKNCNDIDTLDVFRILEHRIANGEKAANIVVGDMVKNFKGNNYLLFKDMKDLRADDFLEYAKHQVGLETSSSAKGLYENSYRLKLTKGLRAAGNATVAAVEIYFTVDFIINLTHLYETGQISAREVGKEAAAYVASTGASWFASSAVASATAVGLPLLGVSAPICAVAVVVFSLAAGIWSGKGADWLMRELYDPAYETTWGILDYNFSMFNGYHLVDGTDGDDIIDCSDGTITAGILTYPISNYVVMDGMDGDDHLVGSIYGDTIYGGGGNDYISGFLGNDSIYGGGGNDSIYGGLGNNELHGSDGSDIIYGGTDNDNIYGDNDSDFLYGGSCNDTIYGGADADEVFGDGGNDELHGDAGDDLIVGGSGDDLIYGGDGDDILSGEDGNDKQYGGNGNDIILGDDGNDTLYGENGNDILDGGAGDDYRDGGSGDDTYIYGKGSGNDTIADSAGENRIRFTDLMPDDLTVYYPPSNNDAVLTIIETEETLTIQNFRSGWNLRNFILEFADGSTLLVDETGSPFLHVVGTNGDDENIISFFPNSIIEVLDGNDKVNASNVDDLIYGGAGNDSLYGKGGNDILDGGTGDDYLDGGSGDDTYIYEKGSGNDTIADSAGENMIRFTDLMPDDLTVYYPPSNKDAILTITETGETLTIQNFRSGWNLRNFILEFADGTTLSVDETGSPFLHVVGTNEDDENIISFFTNSIIEVLDGNDKVRAANEDDFIYGGAGNDSLYGNGGNDVLDGGTGDDYLDGGSGDDTYIYEKGSGNDAIADSAGENRIRFTDLMPDDLTVYYPPSNKDAVLTITETGETLTIQNFRSGDSYRNFDLEFEDGRIGKIDYFSASIAFDPLTVTFGIGNGNVVVPNDVIGEIKFDGLSPADLTAFYSNNNAVLTITSTGETLTIENFSGFVETQKTILSFNNDVKMRFDSEGSPFLNVAGTDLDDTITAFLANSVVNGLSGNDTLIGTSGKDTLYGGEGKDILNGCEDDDYLDGGDGNDTYIYGSGFGNDVINDADGINKIKLIGLNAADLTVNRVDENNDIVLMIVATSETLTINNYRKEGVDSRFVFEFEDMSTGTIDWDKAAFVINAPENGEDANLDKIVIFEIGNGDHAISADSGIDKIKFIGLISTDLMTYFAADGSAVLTIAETGEKFTIENFAEFADTAVVLEFENQEMQLDDRGSPFLNVVGTNSDDEITAFYKNSSMFGGIGNDTYSLAAGFGSNVIEDNDGDNKVKLLGINFDAVSFEMTDSGELVITVIESGDVLTIRNFDSERFTFEFADEVSGTFNVETGEFERILSEEELAAIEAAKTEDELAQANADILDELYADDNSVSDLFTDNADAVISVVTDSVSVTDDNSNTSDQIDIQVMILTENMAAFSNESNISDSISMQSNTDSRGFADQLLVGTQAS